MEQRIEVSVLKDKSFDPSFVVKVSYQDDNVSIKNAIVNVLRKPPKVKIDYPDDIKHLIAKADVKKIELEIMKKIVEFILSSASRIK